MDLLDEDIKLNIKTRYYRKSCADTLELIQNQVCTNKNKEEIK